MSRRRAPEGNEGDRGGRRPGRRWLGAPLVVIGVLLLTAGGLMVHAQQVVPEVPAPVGAPPESLLSPTGGAPSSEDADPGGGGDSAGRPRARADLAAEGAEAAPRERDTSARPWPIDPDAVRALTRPPAPAATPPGEANETEGQQGEPPPPPTPTAEPTATPEPTAPPEPTVAPSPTPFPPAETPPYRLTIRAIGVDTPVIPVGWVVEKKGDTTVTTWEAADYAAGWHKNSRLPGQGGNVVIAGHNNIRGEVFRDLEKLSPGDRVIVYADRRPYVYEVESRFVVPERGQPIEVQRENARWIGDFPKERLTLISCWPYTTYNYRIFVVALPTW